MKKLFAVTLLLLVSTTAHADIAVQSEDGHLLWASQCASSYQFSYFDSHNIQRACVESTDAVPLAQFVALARDHDCYGQVRVDSGIIRDGVLYANTIAKVWGCHDGRGQEFP